MKIKQKVCTFIIGEARTEAAGGEDDGVFQRAFKKRKRFLVDKIFRNVQLYHISRKGTARKNQWFDFYCDLHGIIHTEQKEFEVEVKRVIA